MSANEPGEAASYLKPENERLLDLKTRYATFSKEATAPLTQLADIIARRVCRHLVRNGWLEGEHESAFLSERAGGDDGLDALRLSSITYRIATGTHRGQRRRPRRAALGPLSGMGEKWPQTVAW